MPSALGLDWSAVADFLDAGHDEPIAGLEAALDNVVVAEERPELERALTGHEAVALGLGDEAEVLSVDPGDGNRRDRDPRLTPPDDLRANELLGPEAAVRRHGRLRQNRLRGVVDLRRDEVDCSFREDLPLRVDEVHREPYPDVRPLLDRHLDVDLEPGVLVDGRQDRVGLHAIADAYRNVADDAGRWSGHAVVLQLHAAFLQTRLQRCLRSGGRPQRCFRLVVFLLADRSDPQQFLRALELLLRIADGRLLRRAARFVAVHRRALARGVDLQERRAGAHLVARLHHDVGDDALDLRP